MYLLQMSKEKLILLPNSYLSWGSQCCLLKQLCRLLEPFLHIYLWLFSTCELMTSACSSLVAFWTQRDVKPLEAEVWRLFVSSVLCYSLFALICTADAELPPSCLLAALLLKWTFQNAGCVLVTMCCTLVWGRVLSFPLPMKQWLFSICPVHWSISCISRAAV